MNQERRRWKYTLAVEQEAVRQIKGGPCRGGGRQNSGDAQSQLDKLGPSGSRGGNWGRLRVASWSQ